MNRKKKIAIPNLARMASIANLSVALGCLMTVAGCVGEMGESTVDERSAQIRALHLAPGAPVVDVYVDGAPDPAFDGLEFTRGSRYATLPRGEHSFDIAPEETSIDDAVISVRDVELAGGTSYTAVAYGPNDDLRALLVDDMPITTDGARLRIGHVAAGVGQVDLWVVPDDAEPAPLAEDLDYGTASGIIDVPSGVHVVGLDLDDDAAVDLEFSLPELPDGTAANVFAVTDAFGAPFLLAQLSDGVTTRIDPNDIPTGPTAGNAWVRALHLSPDAPNVDVFVNDDATPSFADIPFTWGTGFAELPGDEYRFRVSATGAPAADAVLDATLPLADGTATTIVAFDRLSDIGALVLEDDFEDVASGTIRIRAIHAAPAVGQVDIYAYGPDGSINRLYDDVDFGTAGEYLDVPAAQYTLGLDLDDDGLPEVRFDIPGLASGTVANVFAVNDAEDDPFLLAQLRDGNTLRIDPSTRAIEEGDVRVVHLSPDAPPVDVFINGADAPIVEDLPFGGGTGFASLPAGSFDVDVSATGTPATAAVLGVDGLDVAAGASYTVVAWENLASIRALALEDDFEGLAPGQIRVRPVHTAAGVGDVDILNLGAYGIAPILYDDLEPGTAGAYADLPAGAYVLGLDLDDDRVAEARYALPSLPAGTVANVFAVAEPDAVYLVAQLNDGTTVRIDSTH